MTAPHRIDRSYVPVAGRLVHVRTAGAGAPLLLLHQSPRSAAELEGLMRELAPHARVIAPDTPGNGLSCPLPQREPALGDYADALAALMQALGLDHAAVYGYHTGASIALALAARWPARVRTLALNGLAAFDPAEQDELLRRYFPPFAPTADGSHLTWLWWRLREQMIFFPWYRSEAAARMPFPLADADGLTAAANDLLLAGDAYRHPYRAAVGADSAALLRTLAMPCEVMATATDPLRPHLERVAPGAPRHVRVGELAAAPGALAARLQGITADMAPTVAAPVPPAAPRPPGPRRYLEVDGALVHLHACRSDVSSKHPPVLLLHDLADDATSWAGVLAGWPAGHEVLAPDAPGFGHSDATAQEPTPAAVARWAVALMRAAGHERFRVVGRGWGAAVAAELVLDHADRIAGAVLIAPPLVDPALLADERALLEACCTRDWAGGHLGRAWLAAHDRAVFHPWFVRSRATSITDPAALRPEALHARAAALLRAPTATLRAHRALNAGELLHRLRAAAGAPRVACARLAWERDGFGPLADAGLPAACTLPAATAGWGAALANANADADAGATS